MKKTFCIVSSCVILIIAIAVSFMISELILFPPFSPISNPRHSVQGIDHYSSGQYESYVGGERAAAYLPKLKSLSGVENAEFLYENYQTLSTLAWNGTTRFWLCVKFDEKSYCEEKSNLQSTAFSVDYSSGAGKNMLRLKQETPAIGYTLDYSACCYDDQNIIVYFVILDELNLRLGNDYVLNEQPWYTTTYESEITRQIVTGEIFNEP